MADKTVFSSSPEDFFYMDINVPCQGACPALTNIPAYIRCLYEKRYNRSYEINRLVNIFPGVLGRICSRPCEDKCRHGEPELGRPVNICHIKRAAADFMEDAKDPLHRPVPLPQHVAIVGSGPAGLSAAHDLAGFGFSVTVFEALDKPGGMLRYGIPEFRLPREILQNEIASILQPGITIKTGIRIGQDVDTAELLTKHDAVLVATGCYRSIHLDIPGEDLSGVHSGLEFMMDVCSGKKPVLGARVLVIGAGFTAFDCARSALRLGATDVTICLRRTEEDLRVTHDEILETKTEGVNISSLMLSRRILGSDTVQGVEFVRTEPGNLGPDNKRKVTAIDGSEFILEADAVIVATGQMPGPFETLKNMDKPEIITSDSKDFCTAIDGLYATGDYVTGPSTVIDAITMGRRAALQIAENLSCRNLRENVVRFEDAKITDRQRAWDYLPRQEMTTIQPVEDRFKDLNAEVESGYDRESAHEEAKRCYLCYLHYEIDMDRCIYCRYCIDVAPRDCIKLVDKVKVNNDGAITGFEETTVWKSVNAIVIDNSRCIRCGECVRVCPVDCISVTKAELMEKAL